MFKLIKRLIEIIRSEIVILDAQYFFLASIPATLRHIKLIRRNCWLYQKIFDKKINWINPVNFSEKIFHFMISSEAEKIAPYTDKYEVRQYIKQTIGQQYLIPLYHIFNNVEEIDINRLPKSFVLKTTHGSNWNIFCPNKNKFKWSTAKKKLQQWLKSNFYALYFAERQYRNLKPRIICEKYIKIKNGLTDYKFYCFHGKAFFIRVMTGRYQQIKKNTYDLNWQEMPLSFLNIEKKINAPKISIPKPKNLKKMIRICQKLAQPFPFVRVDLYNLDGKIYFSELTFTPNAGLDRYQPASFDILLGKLI